MSPALVIVADRGRLIAYRTVANCSLQEVQVFEFEEGRQKLSEQLSDNAGRFPATGTQGHGGGTAERLTLEEELERRILTVIAKRIKELCEQERPESWGFAAPGDINGAILERVDPLLRERLVVNISADLTKVTVKELEKRFERKSKMVSG